MNKYASFWSGLGGDPLWATGASEVGTSDFAEWSALTGFILSGRVLDIGCGTGRMADLCDDYVGVDITPKFVDYAVERGRNVLLIGDERDLPAGPFDRVLMLSVMTHIARADRRSYLAAIRERLDGEALIDILPGTEGGTIGAWYADPVDFEVDLTAHGFDIIAVADWQSRDGHTHRYYRVR